MKWRSVPIPSWDLLKHRAVNGWPFVVAMIIAMAAFSRWAQALRTTNQLTRALRQVEQELASWERAESSSQSEGPGRFESLVGGFAEGEQGASALVDRLMATGEALGWRLAPTIGREEVQDAGGLRIEAIPVELEGTVRPGSDAEGSATRRWIHLVRTLLEESPTVQVQQMVLEGGGHGARRCRLSFLLWVWTWEP